MDPIAHQIRLISDLAGKNGGAVAAGLTFDPAPAPGPVSPHFTESLRDALGPHQRRPADGGCHAVLITRRSRAPVPP